MTSSLIHDSATIKQHGLSSHALKCVALIFMTLDHIGAILQNTTPEAATIFRIIGRAAAPIFAFVLVESFNHTRSRKAMAERLLIFALFAQIPYSFFCFVAYKDFISIFQLNVLFTFYFTFQWLRRIAIDLPFIKYFIFPILLFSLCFFMDWGIFIPIWCIIFYKVKPKIFSLPLIVGYTLWAYVVFYSMHLDLAMLTLNIIGMLFSFPLLWYYNGKRGCSKYLGRYFFYWFYGGHLLALASVKYTMEVLL